MSKSAVVFNNFLMSVVLTAFFSVAGQYLGSGTINFMQLVPSFALGTVVGFLIAQFAPCVPLGTALGRKLGAKPEGFVANACVCFVLASVIAFVQTYLMTVFGVSIMGGAPLEVGFMAATNLVLPFIAAAILICLLIARPIQILAVRLFGTAERA